MTFTYTHTHTFSEFKTAIYFMENENKKRRKKVLKKENVLFNAQY